MRATWYSRWFWIVFLAMAGKPMAEAQDARVRAAPMVTMPKPVDSNSPAFWRDGKLYWYGSHGGPWLHEGPGQFGPWQQLEVWIESRQPGPKWIESVWPEDAKTVWAWYHLEPPDLVPGKTLTAPKIGALVSQDGGLTFDDLGIVLEAGEALNPDAQNGYFAGGHGDFSVLLDRGRRYFYFFFDNYAGPEATQGVCVARMAYEDRHNPLGKVWKYHDGAWQEAGARGAVTPIFPVKRNWAARDPDALWGPAVHWNTYLNCYVMLLNRAQGEPGWAQEGIYVSFSTDLGRPEAWTPPKKILDKAEFPQWYFFYPQVMGLEPEGTDRRAGQVARLYVNGVSRWEIEFVAPAATTGPRIASYPTSGAVAAGTPFVLAVAAAGTPPFAYQWFKDGVAVAGATGAVLEVAAATPQHAGTYTVAVTGGNGTATGGPATVTVSGGTPLPAPGPAPARGTYLSNLAVRAWMEGGEGAGISVGYTVRGTDPKPLLLRAVGPTLAQFGLPEALADPRLRVYDAEGRTVAENDAWAEELAPAFAAVGAFPLVPGSADAAVRTEVRGNSGTMAVTSDGPGLVLVEIYDPAASRSARIVNLSALARAGQGDRVLVGGFGVSGDGSRRVLIRALGPQLAAYGIGAPLHDPVVEVYDGSGALLARSEAWDPALAETFEAAGAPPLPAGSRDAAVEVTLTAGLSYSAVVRSLDGSTGETLLEIYELR